MLFQQYKKELRLMRSELSLIIGALLVLYVFLTTRVNLWPPAVIMGLAILPVGFLQLWALWTGLQLYRQEWRENTHYLLLSLPVPAWKITFPKLAALMTGLAGFMVVLGAGASWLLVRTGLWQAVVEMFAPFPVPLARLSGTIILGIGILFFGNVLASLMVQVAFVLSRLFQRFQGLLVAGLWILQIWLFSFVVEYLGAWLNWLPSVKVTGVNLTSRGVEVISMVFPAGSLWATALFGIALYALMNVTISKAVEV